MGISTVCIGLLPTYAQIGIIAPLLLAVCRLGQGLGLGGEWSGAVLLATENAPEGKKSMVRDVSTARCSNWLYSGNRFILIIECSYS